MKKTSFDFSEMADTARRIESLALMLQTTVESGNLSKQLTEDAATVIGDLATELRHMIAEAQDTAADAA